MAGEDFVHVRLSAAGVKRAGPGGQLRVTAGRNRSFVFHVGQSLRVTRAYEWNVLLKDEQFEGQPLLELAPASSATVTTAKPQAHVTQRSYLEYGRAPVTHLPATGPGVTAFGIQHHPPIADVKEK